MSTNHIIEGKPIVWIDCEMTGLNIREDELCEIAILVTDSDLNLLDEVGLDLVIKPSQRAFDRIKDNDIVREMHKKSGLINEIPNGLTAAVAEQQCLEYLKRFFKKPHMAVLGGNSVGTDKTFMQLQMPNLVDWLHYRVIDVSTLKELSRAWAPNIYINQPAKKETHRALDDIRESIEELRYYRENFLQLR